MKKLICRLTLILAAMVMAFSAAAAETAANTEQQAMFVPATLVPEVNAYMEMFVDRLGEQNGWDAEKIQQTKDDLTLYYTETQALFLYCDNEDWSVEMAFSYTAGEPGVDTPADTFALRIRADVDSEIRNMLSVAMVMAMYLHEPGMDPMAVAEQMDQTEFLPQNTIPLFGDYSMTRVLLDGYYQYCVLH